MNLIQTIKPGIPKRYLLFLAAIVWTFAGGMLLFRGYLLLGSIKHFVWLIILISIIGGALFYILLFSKISLKHSMRIISLKNDLPCMFSFFNVKGYILMTVMITSGILLRKSGIISSGYLSGIYLTMGIPLFISAFRFYYYGFNYRRFIDEKE